MTINTCDGPHYTCGETLDWLTGYDTKLALSQRRDNKTSFMLGVTEIIVASQLRTFDISSVTSWKLSSGAFLMRDADSDIFQCAETETLSSGSVSESITYITTKIHFIDTRYNNGVFTETKEVLSFSNDGEICGFKETWGIQWYRKFVVTNHTVVTTVTHFIVLAGVKTVLKETVTTTYPNTAENPLILVYPNPPSKAIPWINCEDIDEFGFYDYHEGGPAGMGGSDRIKADGGDDYYWPEWMREIGQMNAATDAAMAAERYATFYLNDPDPGTKNLANPGIFIDSTPVGSICRDVDGNVFYSVTLDGDTFNFLTEGNLPELFPLVGDGQYYPVGLA